MNAHAVQTVQMVPVARITVVNPRVREKPPALRPLLMQSERSSILPGGHYGSHGCRQHVAGRFNYRRCHAFNGRAGNGLVKD